jgi:hypothetical protein
MMRTETPVLPRVVSDGHDVTAIVRPDANRWRLADIESRLSIVANDLAACRARREAQSHW